MAQAVQELYPGTKLGIGPAIENGFYYDFDCPHRLTLEDLPRIEEKMKAIQQGNHKFLWEEWDRKQAVQFFKEREETYKVELIESLPDSKLTIYKHDTFTDLCRGPHVSATGQIPTSFKLLSVAGAYWRGDEKRPMLQRIYGTAFLEAKDLHAYLKLLEESKNRDHRKLGPELDLFSIHEEAGPGLIFWNPKGGAIRKIMEDWLREELLKRGYQMVFTPHIMRLDLWKTSGHTDFFAQNMFTPIEIEGSPYQLKPMNCPGHILIYKNRLRSYRELPIRLAELGTVYRYERSGVLHGLLRVRGFTQDDAHIFCRPDQIEQEITDCIDFALTVLKTFGFERFEIDLSTRDPKHQENYAGEPQDWENAESALEKTLKKMKLNYQRIEGEAAFYGPKVDIKLIDSIGRSWQLSTVQFDFNLPKRFALEYVGEDGHRHQPLMVHRALWGSAERFFGILIEHYAGNFPAWLAPVQAKILTVTNAPKEKEYARNVLQQLQGRGFRTELDDREENLSVKVRDARQQKIRYHLVIGPRDTESQSVTVSQPAQKKQTPMTLDQFIGHLKREVEEKLSSCL